MLAQYFSISSLTSEIRSRQRWRAAFLVKQSQTGVTEAENHANPVGLSEFRHRYQVVQDGFLAGGPMQPGDVVQAAQDHHYRGVQGDHVLPEADQHLVGSLPGDSSIQPRFPGKKLRVSAAPEIRDLVAEKDRAIFPLRGRRELGIIAAVTNQAAVVAQRPAVLLLQLPFERLDALRLRGCPGAESCAPRSSRKGGHKQARHSQRRHATSEYRSNTGSHQKFQCRRDRSPRRCHSSGSTTRSDLRSTTALCRFPRPARRGSRASKPGMRRIGNIVQANVRISLLGILAAAVS